MARCLPLKQSSPDAFVQVRLPPVKWIHFTMYQSQFLGNDPYFSAWNYIWKAILLASGVPYDHSTNQARFLLSKDDDHALAVLLRTTISVKLFAKARIIECTTGQSIFSELLRDEDWAGREPIEIVYPSQLSKEEAAKFYVRDKPLEVIEYKTQTETED